MTAITELPDDEPETTYLNSSCTIASWLLTRDHKRIAILYMISITVLFAIGAAGTALVRIDLLTPKGLLSEPQQYNNAFTVHGVIMVFFFLIPSIPAVLGNFLIRLMVGARDLAFPRLNLLSWYLFVIGATLAVGHRLRRRGHRLDILHSLQQHLFQQQRRVNDCRYFIAGFSSVLTGLNFIVTIHTIRAPGMTWLRLPLFCWSLYATSVIFVLGTPVVAITLFLVVVERLLGIGIFDPAIGGDPVLFQHMFWFYSHPAVYIMVLPAMGVVSEIVTCFARKRPFGYVFIAFSSVAIAILSFFVWAHHMFDGGISMYAGLVFSLLSFMVAIPSGVKVFAWTATLYKGSISLATPMLYALGFMGLFTMGGLTGVMLATLGIDMHVHDTYFIIAHFHYIMVGGAVMAYLGGIHFWWPKMTGKMYSEFWGTISAAIIFLGFNLTFFPQFIAGYLGMPRRYHSYPPEFQTYNVLSSAGASILAVGYLLPLVYLLWSLKFGPDAGPNPFRALGTGMANFVPTSAREFRENPDRLDAALRV